MPGSAKKLDPRWMQIVPSPYGGNRTAVISQATTTGCTVSGSFGGRLGGGQIELFNAGGGGHDRHTTLPAITVGVRKTEGATKANGPLPRSISLDILRNIYEHRKMGWARPVAVRASEDSLLR